MKNYTTTSLATAALLALAPAVAGADGASGVDANLYRPNIDGTGVLSLDSAGGLHQYDFTMGLNFGFAQDPLRLAVPGIGGVDDESVDSALKFALTLHLTAAFAFTERLSFGVDVGMYRTDPDDGYGERGTYRAAPELSDPSTGLISLRPLSNIDPSGGYVRDGVAGPLDVRLGLKYRLLMGPQLRLALLALVSLPFGEEEMFLGDRSLVFEPRIAIDYGLGSKARLVANVGARLRRRNVLEVATSYDQTTGATTATSTVFDLGSEAVAGLGVALQLAPQLLVDAEVTAFIPLPGSTSWGDCTLYLGGNCGDLTEADYFAGVSEGDFAGYAMAGLHYRATPDTTINVGGGTARLGGNGRGEAFRILGGITWAPTPEGTRTIGKGDSDGDGIGDQIDICPDEPEDTDGYQDDDGCPDLDNDGDGVIDAQDACSDEPEDRDGYQDDDGCPERDNDGDDVPDVTDRCPNDREDKDNFEDDDGCPEEDNDGDGISDTKDRCPNEPETVNGFDDLDGCPDDKVTGGPRWDPDRIDMQGSHLQFASTTSSTLTKASQALLDDVATLMTSKEGAERKVRVEVHVRRGTTSDNASRIRTQKRKDKRLSQQRAERIRAYLVSKGIAPSRVQASGLGSDLPIRPDAPTAEENERVDFIRTEQR